MGATCIKCGKTITEKDAAFCPYCGEKLSVADNPGMQNTEAGQWVRKALSMTNYFERKKVLLKGLEACPDSREIEWELLFIGDEPSRRKIGIDFSIIKSWILEIYRKPGDFSEERRTRMHTQLFDAPELMKTFNRFENPAEKQREYLQRLCTEYVELFLEGSNQVMGNIFGFHIERNKEKKLAVPVAEMIERIQADEKLLPEQREQLSKAMYQAYSLRTNGKTEYLDEQLTKN